MSLIHKVSTGSGSDRAVGIANFRLPIADYFILFPDVTVTNWQSQIGNRQWFGPVATAPGTDPFSGLTYVTAYAADLATYPENILVQFNDSYSHRGFSPVSETQLTNRKPFKRFPVASLARPRRAKAAA